MPEKGPISQREIDYQSVRQNIELIRDIEERALNARTTSERLADVIGSFCGSMTFVVIHLVLFAGWMVVNTAQVGGIAHFDPYPYLFMSLVVSLEAIFLSTFVLMKQNRMSRRADSRARLDLQINLLAEKEMTLVLKMLSRMSEHMGLHDLLQDPELHDLASQTPVEAVAEQLEQTVLE